MPLSKEKLLEPVLCPGGRGSLAWAQTRINYMPYQILRRVPGREFAAEKLGLKQYASSPFRVCVNDQLDRFSAPIEKRCTRKEVAAWLGHAGFEDPRINAAYGWVGTGRKSAISVALKADIV